MTDQIAIHAYVSGKVQGVFYRDTTQRKANSLGLTGWVKNLPDGRVELIVCGAEQPVNDLVDWLWQGSPASDVTNVQTERVSADNFDHFEVRY